MAISTLPGLFISHGSPMLAIEPEQIGAALHRLSINLPKPRAIIVMSAHWETQALEISTSPRPETWHDFSGFPRELYQIHYPASGDPQLAERLIHLLQQADMPAHANSLRPRDHGVWMPLLHLYPDADIPIVQISLPIQSSAQHIYRIGQLLSTLRQEQILLIGSGSITHNLAELDWAEEPATTPYWASTFRNWIVQQLHSGDFEAVLNWPTAPFIHQNHPTLEHLAPLFFAMGTGTRFSLVHSSFSMGSLGMDLYRFD